jgi:hypothetical protein
MKMTGIKTGKKIKEKSLVLIQLKTFGGNLIHSSCGLKTLIFVVLNSQLLMCCNKFVSFVCDEVNRSGCFQRTRYLSMLVSSIHTFYIISLRSISMLHVSCPQLLFSIFSATLHI